MPKVCIQRSLTPGAAFATAKGVTSGTVQCTCLLGGVHVLQVSNYHCPLFTLLVPISAEYGVDLLVRNLPPNENV